MKITNQMDGTQLEIPDIDPAALGRFIAERATQANTAGLVAEDARRTVVRRSALNCGHLAAEVARTCQIPVSDAVTIVMQVSHADINNARLATEEFYSNHVTAEVQKLNDPKKGLRPVPPAPPLGRD